MIRIYTKALSQIVCSLCLMLTVFNYSDCFANNQIYTQKGHSEITKAILNDEIEKAVNLIENSQKTEWLISWEVFREVAEPHLEVADFSKKNHTEEYPLLAAVAASGHVSIARALINKGAQVDFRVPNEGSTAIMFASKMHNTEMVKLLLSKNSDLSILTTERRPTGALAYSLEYMESGLEELVALELLKSPYGEKILKNRTSLQIRVLLETAAYNGLLQVVKRFDELGVSLHGRNRLGATLLHYALMGGTKSGEDVAIYLIQQGLDPNQYYATDKIILLAEQGTDIPNDKREGKTPLAIAIDERTSTECIEQMIRLGADVKQASLNGVTPLETARMKNRHELIELMTE